MLKKIAIIAILAILFIGGNLFADGEERYYYNVQVEIHGTCNHLIVGYEAQDGWHTTHDSYQTLPPGTYDRSFSIPATMYPANTITAKGWGDYAAYDEDECVAQFYYPNELELWIGVVPDPGEPEPQEE